MGLQRLAVANPASTTDTTLFTADNQYLASVIIVNKNTSNLANCSVWVVPSGATVESEYAYIIYDFPIDSTNSYETFRFAVNQNDEIHIQCNNADCSVQVIGLVQFDVNLGVGISSYSATAPTNVVDGLIWVDSDATLTGGKHPAYVWDSTASSWAEFVGGIDESADYTFTGTNTFTGTVVLSGYEKEIPLQSTAPSSPNASDLWVDSVSMQLKVYDGAEWTALGAAVDDSQLVIAQRMFMS